MQQLTDQQKGLQKLINKAWEDDSFRAQLVANPGAAIKSATGKELPSGINVVVNDQTDPNVVYLNIPPKPNWDDMDLTDEQLEAVAGGEIVVAIITATVAATASTAAAGISQGWAKPGGPGW